MKTLYVLLFCNSLRASVRSGRCTQAILQERSQNYINNLMDCSLSISALRACVYIYVQ